MRSPVRIRLARASSAAALFLAAGCDVGPKYERPAVYAPNAFKEAAATQYAGLPEGTWRPAQPADGALKGKWWEMFHEPELDALEEQLNVNNQTIAQSFQNFLAARAEVGIARAGYFPTVSVDPSVVAGSGGARSASAYLGTGATTAGGTTTAGSTSYTSGGTVTTVNYFTLPADASWAPDLWGRVRNSVREYRYAAQVSAADLENQRLIEQASLAQFFFQLRGQDALRDLYERTVTADRQSLDLTQARSQTGVDSEQSVAQAQVTLENAQASAVGIAVNRGLYEHAIATLIGKPASEFSMPVKALETSVPAVPVAVPSKLLERRPDVAAAERTLAQANALIGVAVAAYYPSLNLSASGGFASTALGTLFTVPSLFWSLGASASQIIFDGGLRGSTVEQYEAMYRADVAAYRQTVLTAFQQVEDFVGTLRVLSQQVARQELAVRAARRFLDIALAAYETGIDPYLDVITAQTTLLADEQTLVTLRVNEMTAAVQLVQALGGGWDGSKLPTEDEVTSKEGLRKISAP